MTASTPEHVPKKKYKSFTERLAFIHEKVTINLMLLVTCLTPTGHLWYAQRAATSTGAAIGQRLDLDKVLPCIPGRDLKLHAGPVGLQHRGRCVPVVTVEHLQRWKRKLSTFEKKKNTK